MKTIGVSGRSGEKAFTLIELLVVVSIIGILASLAVPALSSANVRAEAIGCVSNLREIGMAVEIYAADHCGVLPVAWDGSTTYATVLEPYISQKVTTDKKNVFVCPGNILPVAQGSAGIITYSMHDKLGSGVRLIQIKSPATTFLFTDGTQVRDNGSLSSATVWLPNELIYPTSATNPEGLVPATGDSDGGWDVQGNIRYRHGHAANFLMADGHVEAIKAGALRYKNGGTCE